MFHPNNIYQTNKLHVHKHESLLNHQNDMETIVFDVMKYHIQTDNSITQTTRFPEGKSIKAIYIIWYFMLATMKQKQFHSRIKKTFSFNYEQQFHVS